MTPQERAEQLVQEIRATLDLSDEQARELREMVSRTIAQAISEENDACAKIVEEKLRARILYASGIPGAIRERIE